MSWLRRIGGRLGSSHRYSIALVYNTFPLPPKNADLSKLEPLAQAILNARTAHIGATLADPYDPDQMPPDLRRAHQGLESGCGPPLQALWICFRTSARRASVHAVREVIHTAFSDNEASSKALTRVRCRIAGALGLDSPGVEIS